MSYGNFAQAEQNAEMSQEKFLLWVSDQLAKQGRGAKSRLAEHMDIEPSAVSRLLKGERSLLLDEAQGISDYFAMLQHSPAVDVTFPPLSSNRVEGCPNLLVRGNVAAGLWLEASVFENEVYDEGPIKGGDDRYPFELQYLMRIQGESLNKIAQDGDLILCLDHGLAGLEIQSGDLVVVERSRDDGHTIERTAKRIFQQNGKIELRPESNDPRFQDPLVFDEHDEEATEVRVIAKVLWVIKRE